MRLGISSAGAPDADVQTLVSACSHRGLAALELRAGDGHGLGTVAGAADAGASDAATARSRAAGAGVEIVGLRIEDVEQGAPMASVATALDAPLVAAGNAALHERLLLVRELGDAGTPSLLEVRGPVAAWLPGIAGGGVQFAWTIDEGTADPVADIEAMLQAGKLPAYIRMAGGVGPESPLGEGRGLGPVMARLTLARYGGPLILVPGSVPYRIAWEQWMGSRGGWGCGSSAEKRDTVRLTSGVRGGTT